MFVGLEPLGNLEAKTRCTLEAMEAARHAEIKGGGAHSPGLLALLVAPEGLKFMGAGTVLAGKRNVRRILLATARPLSLA